MILLADSEGPDQTARMRRLIWAFAVRLRPKTLFRMARLNLCLTVATIDFWVIKANKLIFADVNLSSL